MSATSVSRPPIGPRPDQGRAASNASRSGAAPSAASTPSAARRSPSTSTPVRATHAGLANSTVPSGAAYAMGCGTASTSTRYGSRRSGAPGGVEGSVAGAGTSTRSPGSVAAASMVLVAPVGRASGCTSPTNTELAPATGVAPITTRRDSMTPRRTCIRTGKADRAPDVHTASIDRRRRSRSSAWTAASQSQPRAVEALRPVTARNCSLVRRMPSSGVPLKSPRPSESARVSRSVTMSRGSTERGRDRGRRRRVARNRR